MYMHAQLHTHTSTRKRVHTCAVHVLYMHAHTLCVLDCTCVCDMPHAPVHTHMYTPQEVERERDEASQKFESKARQLERAQRDWVLEKQGMEVGGCTHVGGHALCHACDNHLVPVLILDPGFAVPCIAG